VLLNVAHRTVSALLFPFIARIKHVSRYSRILSFFLGFGPCFIILSISVEGLFYLTYSAMLLAWIEIEAALRPTRTAPQHHSDGYPLRADDMRISLFFLFFVQIAFFGTGK